jgi:hypothetical protein
MRGTRAGALVGYYGSLGKPLVLMTDRRDGLSDRIDDGSVASVDWPPDRRELVETVRAIAAQLAAGAATDDGR